nr:HORMA domain-containing protein 1-like isoform X3 [Nerophis lumbriciformis]
MATGKMCIKKSKEETTEWTGLFPNDLKKKEGSLVFVKRMMAVAVSSITYLRGIFPEDAYRSRYLEDLCIKVLRENCSTPGPSKVVKWLIGCFDALDKQYLQVVFIGVYTDPDEPNCIVESYNFKFKYTDEGPEMDVLRKLFLLMQNLNALPNNIHMTMKLYYYDDITPADYEPPGFKEGECDSLWFEGTAVHFTLGEVQTTFHTFQVRVSAEQGRLEKLQDQKHVEEVELPPRLKRDISKTTTQGPFKIVPNDLPSDDESAQFKKPAKPLVKRNTARTKPPKKRRRRRV